MEEFDHLKIQLEDIISATDNFAPNKRIGGGGFGSVYKGELSHPQGPKTVACKRLDPRFGQGHVEFLKEIVMLSKYKHENLVSLLHFCIEGDERILVYEYASRGSLDRYLSDTSLTWMQRLKICIGAANALNYLHDPADTHQRILHRDIKSSNILLDENWNAKVSDFGLSKIGPANQPHTYVISNAVGTPGYCDPLYIETGILTKESDVYSFGVVLFEVMCGKSCYEYRDGSFHAILVPTWKKCFQETRLDDIISQKHMEPGSLNTFSTIAYQCLKKTHKERPTMAKIVEELKIALELQEVFDDIGRRISFDKMPRIADLAVPPLFCTTQSQLLLLYLKGVLVDNGFTWFSVNKEGQHCELISALKLLCFPKTGVCICRSNSASRFKYLLKFASYQDFRLTVMTQFLSPNVTYIINIVYKCNDPHKLDLRIPFKYKRGEMREYLTSCVAYVGEDGWLRTELFQFTSTKKEHYFDIQFSIDINCGPWDRFWPTSIEGIEFCPIDFGNTENKVDMQPIADSDIDWSGKLPYGYAKIVKWSKSMEESMTRKEVYFLLRNGVHINDSQQWFSINKKSTKRLMLPARAILREEKPVWSFLSGAKSWKWKSLPGSRFREAAEFCDTNHLSISLLIESLLLSTYIVYACYLVFKLPENASAFEGVVITGFKGRSGMNIPVERFIYIVTPPHTPIIELSPADETPSRIRKIKGHPKLRKDGWMEVQVWEFRHSSPLNTFWVDGYLKSLNKWNFTGLLVQGIELRPAKVS